MYYERPTNPPADPCIECLDRPRWSTDPNRPHDPWQRCTDCLDAYLRSQALRRELSARLPPQQRGVEHDLDALLDAWLGGVR